MKQLSDVVLVQLRTISDHRGHLVPIESGIDCLLKIRRTFLIYGVPQGEVRGHHAHLATKQFFVCTSGQCTIECNDGTNKATFVLNSPNQGLFLPEMIWSHQTYDLSGTTLMTLCDKSYDENDYLRNFEEYKKARA